MVAAVKQVLLIEEEPTLREITAFRLELLGYQVTALESADGIVERVSNDRPNAVIVGHFLQGISGLDVLDRLSTDVRTAGAPVMFLSPNSDLEDVQKAFTAGADEYLVTPFDPMVLEKKINRLTTA
ncbi:response regulator [Pirellulimonas nuda]|nr:response regulator [Pirellulimonas nuda]